MRPTDGGNDLGIIEILVLIIFGVPTLLSIGMVWLTGLRRIVLTWLVHHELLTRHPFFQIPGAQGLGPTVRGVILAVGLIAVLVGVGALGVTRARQQAGGVRAPAN